jgi:microcystin degradation protein MlrC
MVAEGVDDAGGYILNKVRRVVGYDVPLEVSLDMHANITERRYQREA